MYVVTTIATLLTMFACVLSLADRFKFLLSQLSNLSPMTGFYEVYGLIILILPSNFLLAGKW